MRTSEPPAPPITSTYTSVPPFKPRQVNEMVTTALAMFPISEDLLSHPAMETLTADDLIIPTDKQLIDSACQRMESATLEQVLSTPVEELFPDRVPHLQLPSTHLTAALQRSADRSVIFKREATNRLTQPETFHSSHGPEIAAGKNRVCRESVITIKIFNHEKHYVELVGEFLSSNRMSDVRQVFTCRNNTTHDSPEFVFIKNTFYTTQPYVQEVQKNLVDWMEFRKMSFEGITSNVRCTGDDPQLGDIEFTIDTPYVFGHMNSCEHIFYVSDVRALTHDDMSKVFPRIVFRKRTHPRRCFICECNYARFVSERLLSGTSHSLGSKSLATR